MFAERPLERFGGFNFRRIAAFCTCDIKFVGIKVQDLWLPSILSPILVLLHSTWPHLLDYRLSNHQLRKWTSLRHWITLIPGSLQTGLASFWVSSLTTPVKICFDWVAVTFLTFADRQMVFDFTMLSDLALSKLYISPRERKKVSATNHTSVKKYLFCFLSLWSYLSGAAYSSRAWRQSGRQVGDFPSIHILPC